jgi:hypothetical protein
MSRFAERHKPEADDLSMALKRTCQLCGAHSFARLAGFQSHAQALTASPARSL